MKQGVVVNGYEHPFLFLIQKNPAKPLRDINFSLPMKLLIQGTAARMKGFDLAETKDYYRAIIRKAVEQAAAIGDIPQREQAIDRNFEWILMDDHFPTVFTYGRPYYPVWTRGSTVSDARRAVGRARAPAAARRSATWPRVRRLGREHDGQHGLGHLARRAQSRPSRRRIPRPQRGRPRGRRVLPGPGRIGPAAAGAGGGGGCACAGCACACACAGGGR